MAFSLLGVRLHEAVAAVCPIQGVQPGENPPASVRIDFDPSATAPQQAAAQGVVNGFDYGLSATDLFAVRRATRQIGQTTAVRLPADRATTLASYQDCIGLAFELDANAHYGFRFEGAYDTAGVGTGIQLAINGPAQSFLAVVFQLFTATNAVLAAVAASYDAGVNGTASGGATVLPFTIYGNLTTTAAGLLTVRFRSETAGQQVRIRRGSQGTLVAVS